MGEISAGKDFLKDEPAGIYWFRAFATGLRIQGATTLAHRNGRILKRRERLETSRGHEGEDFPNTLPAPSREALHLRI